MVYICYLSKPNTTDRGDEDNSDNDDDNDVGQSTLLHHVPKMTCLTLDGRISKLYHYFQYLALFE